MKHNTKFFTAVLIFSLAIQGAFSQSVFNGNFSEAEMQKINSGEVLIKNTGKVDRLGVNAVNSVTQKAIDTVKALKPAYLAEIVQVRPYVPGEDIFKTFDDLIMDIQSYVGIPYYSEHNDIWVDLYSSANILSLNRTAEGSSAKADLYMEPFGIITTSIKTEITGDSYYYESKNESKVKYNGITCVNKNNMRNIIVIFRDGDNVVFYGLGAVNAPTFAFIRDRVELSFMNRIKTFCNFFFSKLKVATGTAI